VKRKGPPLVGNEGLSQTVEQTMPPDRTFRRNFLVIAGLHVVAVAVIYFVGAWHRKSTADRVMWLEDGSVGGGNAGSGEAAPEPPPAPAKVSNPVPPPMIKSELISVPSPKMAPSEIVTSKATPAPTTPKPSTPRPHTPKPTPKPTPRHTPTPKPATPRPTANEDGEDATPKPKASPSEKPKASPSTAKTDSSGSTTNKSSGATGGNGPGSGNGKGPAKSGSGSGTSEFGWYFSMIHDRFHSRWDQPTNLTRSGQDIVTTLRIRISKDGTIQNREILHSSGDTTMDESVMTAAERVQQIDPLPSGLGNGEFFEVNVAFKLDQAQ
jgi:TonB family protein